MPATKIQIANDALVSIGHRQINSFSDENDTVRKINAVWDIMVDSTLEACNWNFARNWIALKKIENIDSVDNPFYGSWLFAYQVPNECAKVRIVFAQGHRYIPASDLPKFTELQYNGQMAILTDCDTAFAEYTMRIHDESQFTGTFCTLLSAALAAKIAMPVSMNPEIAKSAQQAYMFWLGEARRENYERDNDKETPNGGYVDGRR